MRRQAILLPGIVLPAGLAFEGLCEALGAEVDAELKDWELYAGEVPPPDYSIEVEVESALRVADRAGFDRFHLVGYSGGGAVAVALAARHPERLSSLALLEPAWIGNQGMTAREDRVWEELKRIGSAPADELLPRFVRVALAPGVETPAPPPAPPPPWMAKRPAGIAALIDAFLGDEIDHHALRAFPRPVYLALGGLSNPDYYGEIARRCERIFPDFELEVYEERHHFDPPHRAEPERLARSLTALWDRSG